MKTLFISICIAGLSLSSFAQTVLHNEAEDGDLSSDFNNPTQFGGLESDNFIITATQGGNGDNADYFSFEVVDGAALLSITVDGYTATGTNNQAFIGIQQGSPFTQGPADTMASDLYGGLTYGSQNLNTDILPEMGMLGNAQGFTPPLDQGVYTLWLNQTGQESTVTLNLEISVPAATEEFNVSNVTLYPNPTRGEMEVHFRESVQLINITIVDIVGRAVFKTTHRNFDISSLPSGVYFATVETEQGTITKKISKQ